MAKKELRIYDQNPSNPKGTPEDTTRCVKSIWNGLSLCWWSRQCKRKRGHGKNGEYCKQHAKENDENPYFK